MKIAIFAQNMFPPWIEGIKNNSLLLCRELSKYMDITVVSHRNPGTAESSTINGFKVLHLLKTHENKVLQCVEFFFGAFRSLVFLYKEKIPVVSFQYLEISFVIPMFFIAAFKPETSFLLTLYSTDELTHWYKRWTLILLRRKFKKIIIISEYLRGRVREFGFTDEDIVYIPLSYDKERYLSKADFSKRDRDLILFSAGPIEEAGSFFMVETAKKLPNFQFLFAMRQFNRRSEEELQLLQEYIDQHWVYNIKIVRNLTDMENMLSRVGCLVLPLQTIDIKMLIPVALLEAMARGTICFVSDLPNLVQLIDDGRNAIVFDRNDTNDLTEKILRYSGNAMISDEAYKFAEDYPAYEEIAKQYYQVISEVAWSI